MMQKQARPELSRRGFFKAAGGAAAALAAPYVVPSSVFGAGAPSNRINIGCIGVGRMGTADFREVIGRDGVQVLAACDVDAWRVDHAKGLIEKHYADEAASGTYKGCATYKDFRELIARPDIDLVQISTPDFQHAIPAIAAARAGKDIFIQKPFTYTVEEGRILADTVKRYGRILQVGSQQRSDRNFRFACELVRNGRIGKLHTVKVGLPMDVPGPICKPMPVPEELDYEMWLGPNPWVPYTLERVHPRHDVNGRPGWLRVQEYCLGMITGWGAHHFDIAQWGMNTEHTGPVEMVGSAEYPTDGVWDVHIGFKVEHTYASGVKVIGADSKTIRAGVTFEGDEGWVWVTRGAIDANPKSLLRSEIRADEVRLPVSTQHKQNMLDAIRTRTEPLCPAEVGHRSNTLCVLGHIAMKLAGQKLKWDPAKERFTNSDEANRMLSRAYRQPWHL